MKKAILSLLLMTIGFVGFGQVTTSSISGVVKNQKNEVLVGATIQATHVPTGTKYNSATNKNGSYVLPAVRVGGPYIIQATYVGYGKDEVIDVNTQLGVTSNVNFFLMDESIALKEVVVTAGKNSVFSKEKTGAAQQFGRRELTTVPITGARTIDGITKYNPFGNGNSFGAQDSRLNNFTIDGSQFTIVTAAKFDEKVQGFRLGAPIIKNKLFIFGNYEGIERTEPGTNWISEGSPLTGTQISRVKYNDMKTLSDFMNTKFGYVTGPWEGYSNTNTSNKFLIRTDWNINDKNKLTARYVFHNSEAQINISNSQSAGAGNRTTQFNAMSFQNSGYTIQDNTRSLVLELNSTLSKSLFNNLIVSYDKQIENRGYMSQMFPTIDIREGSATYTSVGFDPFTPGNKLDYTTFNITNNLTKYLDKHTLVGGFNYQKYQSNNLFFPASNGVYIFNSLNDFYTAANQSLANGGAPSAFAPARFQFRYSALPGAVEPLQTLKSDRLDLYLQDEFDATQNLKLTFGIRANIIGFEQTALENPAVTSMTFANGERFNTGVLPKTQLLFEPRFGFNYDVKGNKKTQIRGGTGVFTGRPPYVFLSNQIGNNGVLTGFIDVSGAAAANYGFTANPNQYFIPSTPTLPSTFDLAFTDQNYRFPQVWKNNLAVDQKLPWLGLVASVELLYNKTLNAVHYYNANLDAPVGTLGGVDNRPRYAGNDAGVRVNDNVSMGAVLTNRDGAYNKSATFKLEKPVSKGLWGYVAYTAADAQDFMDAGSIASGSWQSALSVNGNNNLDLATSSFVVKNRIVGLLGYRIDYGKKYGGATTFTLGYVGSQNNPFSYIVAGDLNGDRVNNNDLVFVPNSGSDIRFATLTVGSGATAVTYTEAQQQAAFDAYISQDPYLSTRRGQYAERNALDLPFLHRFDLSVAQDIFIKIAGKRNAFQIRADILNFGNMLNNEWGVSQRVTNSQLLNFVSRDANNVPTYRLATQRDASGTYLIRDTYQYNSSVFDVWSAQLGIRYTFGR